VKSPTSFAAIGVFLFGATLATEARADSLDAIFARMDEASKKFKSVSATIHESDYTAVLGDTTHEDGKLAAKRTNKGIRARFDFVGADARTVVLHGNMVEMYWPKGKQVEDFDISKYTSPKSLDQLLLLSFGAASGEEIKSDYDVSIGGTEKIDSKTATRVELTPKSADLKKAITRITLWIPEGESRAVQEKVEEPSKNYVQWTYSDVKVNAPIPDADIELKLPPGVKRIGAN
jgi:outer membrane lipoprotein-sorting protein